MIYLIGLLMQGAACFFTAYMLTEFVRNNEMSLLVAVLIQMCVILAAPLLMLSADMECAQQQIEEKD